MGKRDIEVPWGFHPHPTCIRKPRGFLVKLCTFWIFYPTSNFPSSCFPGVKFSLFLKLFFFLENVHKDQFISQVLALLSPPGRSKAGFFNVGEKQCFLGDSLHVGLSRKCAGVYMSLGSFYEPLSLITWIALNYDCLLICVSLLIQLKLLVDLESSVSSIIFPAWCACSMKIRE